MEQNLKSTGHRIVMNLTRKASQYVLTVTNSVTGTVISSLPDYLWRDGRRT
jgi:uncharacterized FlaG/YvyC family protein